jgi:hypothetical protein
LRVVIPAGSTPAGFFFEEARFPFSYAYFHNLMAVFVRHP